LHEVPGILVSLAGRYKWKPGTRGGPDASTPNYEDVLAGEHLVASGHTHPYRDKEAAFSGADLGNMALHSEDVKFARSGDATYAVARTAEFQKLLEQLGGSRLKDRMVESYQGAFDSAKGSLQKRSEAATQAVCEEYHLLFYKGSGATLDRVK